MFGKLLKHEFKATGRTLGPLYGGFVALVLAACGMLWLTWQFGEVNRIGKTVRQVRHTCAISQTFLPGLRFLHIVTHVHLCKVSADTDPAGVIITRGNMIAFCFNTSIVAVRAV